MVRYVYFLIAGSLSCFWQQSSRSIHWISLKFELAPVTKLLNLNAPQCCIIECCPCRACTYLFTKITFLTSFLPKLSFYNIIYFSLAAREIGRQADWIGKHFPMPFAFPVQNVNSFFDDWLNFCLHFISYQQIDSFPFSFSFIQQYCQF